MPHFLCTRGRIVIPKNFLDFVWSLVSLSFRHTPSLVCRNGPTFASSPAHLSSIYSRKLKNSVISEKCANSTRARVYIFPHKSLVNAKSQLIFSIGLLFYCSPTLHCSQHFDPGNGALVSERHLARGSASHFALSKFLKSSFPVWWSLEALSATALLLHVHRPETALKNQETELIRNKERLQFFKVSSVCNAHGCSPCTARHNGCSLDVFPQWCSKAFKNVSVVPPDIGSLHQLNLEYLSRVVQESEGFIYPDSVVGTDSHTTMMNGLGILGWGECILLLSQTHHRT